MGRSSSRWCHRAVVKPTTSNPSSPHPPTTSRTSTPTSSSSSSFPPSSPPFSSFSSSSSSSPEPHSHPVSPRSRPHHRAGPATVLTAISQTLSSLAKPRSRGSPSSHSTFISPPRPLPGKHDVSAMSREAAFARLSALPGPHRPQFQRQRSNSLPTLPTIRPTNAEASIILSAGENAAARRRRPHSQGDSTGLKTQKFAAPIVPTPITEEPATRPQSEYAKASLPLIDESVLDVEPDNSMVDDVLNAGQRVFDDNPTPKASPSKQFGEEHQFQTPRKNSLKSYAADLSSFIKTRLESLSPNKPQSPEDAPVIEQASVVRLNGRKPAKEQDPFQGGMLRPPQRPPLMSAFSEWSTTTDESDTESREANVPDVPLMPPNLVSRFSPSTPSSVYTASIINCYDHESGSQNDSRASSPDLPELSPHGSLRTSMDSDYLETRNNSVCTARLITITSPKSSAQNSPVRITFSSPRASPSRPSRKATTLSQSPPLSPTGHRGSRRPPSGRLASDPSHLSEATKKMSMLTAISPYEGEPLTKVYDISFPEPNRIVTEGLSFDLVTNPTRKMELSI